MHLITQQLFGAPCYVWFLPSRCLQANERNLHQTLPENDVREEKAPDQIKGMGNMINIPFSPEQGLHAAC